MDNRKHKFFTKQQHGGMLVELMLSIAIAAIIIPFIVRYQQTAILRAKNIAVAKQMELVQNALERYITQQKSTFLNHVGNHNWVINIAQLKDYGLPDHIADEYAADYQISVLKSGAGENAVLQGVVVLSNDNISAFRTREIANLGSGRFGFVEGPDVFGGFNVFKTSASSLGLPNNITKGIVGTTETTASTGNSAYLWRVPSDSSSNSTMQSNLNLNGQNVSNIGTLNVTGSFAFFGILDVENITDLMILEFTKAPLLSNVTYATNAISLKNSANLLGDSSHKITVHNGLDNGNFDITSTGTFGDITVDNLTITRDLVLNDIDIPADTEITKVGGVTNVDDMVVDTISINGKTASQTNIGSITTDLRINNTITSGVKDSFYWDLNEKTGVLNDIVLKDLKTLVDKFCYSSGSNGYYIQNSYAAIEFCDKVRNNRNVTVGQCITYLNALATKVLADYYALYPK